VSRGGLTDEQWTALVPVLPPPAVLGRPRVWPRRQLIDGIRWRDAPARYGPWQTVYGLFRRWQRDGTWARILARLQAVADAAGAICWQVSVDSTVCRAHQHAAGAWREGHRQREPPGGPGGRAC
jgi:transposase